MFIVNGGIPRSGTVLIGEILRALMRRRGHDVRRLNPQERRNLPRLAQHIRNDPSKPATLVHTHLIDQTCLDALAGRSDAVLFWNHRDPRDALVSLMCLHDMSLEQALHSMEIYLGAADIARHHPDCRQIRYERLVADTPRHICRIASVIGWQIQEDEVASIAEATSATRHADVMRAVRNGQAPDVQNIRTLRREMREDAATLINDRHIQSGRPGRWRAELSEEDQDRVTARLARWIDAYGYPR